VWTRCNSVFLKVNVRENSAAEGLRPVNLVDLQACDEQIGALAALEVAIVNILTSLRR